MPRIIKKLKDKLTPQIYHKVSDHHHWLMIIGVSFVLISFGYALTLVLIYDKILTLEAAIAVLATR